MPELDATFAQLADHCRETALLNSIEALLGWDERTMLPPAGGEYRADQIAYMAGMVHRHRTDPRLGEWLDTLLAANLDPHSDSGATARELKRQYDRRVKLPQQLVEELARTSVLGQQAWVTARANNDFTSFKPLLAKTFQLKRDQAAALGYPECPYDALLDDYEPGALTSRVAAVLADLREQLVPLVAEIRDSGRSPNTEIITRRYPIAAQEKFAREVSQQIGFDYHRGRLDVTHHPFCSTQGPHDCRITTRYDEHHFNGAFFGTLHEAGHGIYDQGLRPEWYGLPPGEAISLGIHESQSRMWENLVARSRPFWQHFYPAAQAAFPEALAGVSPDEFYWAVNDVRPSLIRVEADEATYNLHILVRFELEQALLNDELRVDDLPGAWNEKYQHYLGLTPPTDADGVLQDVHWSAGLVGYFPTYSLGNLYAAQFFRQADADLGGLDSQFAAGQFEPLRNWLREKIHSAGQCYTAEELVQRVTGKPLAHEALMLHLRGKLEPLYRRPEAAQISAAEESKFTLPSKPAKGQPPANPILHQPPSLPQEQPTALAEPDHAPAIAEPNPLEAHFADIPFTASSSPRAVRKPKNPVTELTKIILGGAVGLLLGYVILLWVFKVDPFHFAPHLPSRAVPKNLEP